MYCIVLLAALLAANLRSSYAEESLGWVTGDGQLCSDACKEQGLVAPHVGDYTDGGSFYVCRSDIGGEGNRPGYNLNHGRWGSRCTIGYGEEQEEETYYECLCVTPGVNVVE